MKFEETVKKKAMECKQLNENKNTIRQKEINTYKNNLYRKYSKRVISLLDKLAIIKENDKEFYNKLYDTYEVSKITHKIGLFGNDSIGYEAGGSLGNVPFVFSRTGISFDDSVYQYDIYSFNGIDHMTWSTRVMYDFASDFTKLETEILCKIEKEYY
jgi:hypothetical protein